MSARDPIASIPAQAHAATPAPAEAIAGALVCELIAFVDDACTPLVGVPAPWLRAVRARAAVELRGEHIGGQVVVVFEGGDPGRPIVLGVLRGDAALPQADPPCEVEMNADGTRLCIRARKQLVLSCGRASITLTQAGKVLIRGAYVLSHSTGVNRVKGGSVQIN